MKINKQKSKGIGEVVFRSFCLARYYERGLSVSKLCEEGIISFREKIYAV